MLALALLMLVSVDAPQPKALYARACAQCHGADLGGRSAEGVRLPGPSLLDAKRRSAWTPQGLTRQIQEGRGAMPAHRAKFRDDEAEALAAWLMDSSSSKRKGKG